MEDVVVKTKQPKLKVKETDMWLLYSPSHVHKIVFGNLNFKNITYNINHYTNTPILVTSSTGIGHGNIRNVLQNSIDAIKTRLFSLSEGNTYYITPTNPDLGMKSNGIDDFKLKTESQWRDLYKNAGMFLAFCLCNDISIGMRFCNFIMCQILKKRPTKHQRIWHYLIDRKDTANGILKLMECSDDDLRFEEFDDGTQVTAKNVKDYVKQVLSKKAEQLGKPKALGNEDEETYNPHPERLASFVSGFRLLDLNIDFLNALGVLDVQSFVKCINNHSITELSKQKWLNEKFEEQVNVRGHPPIKEWLFQIIQESNIEFINDLIWFWTGLKQLPQPDQILYVAVIDGSMSLPKAQTCFYTIVVSKDRTDSKEKLKTDLQESIDNSKALRTVND